MENNICPILSIGAEEKKCIREKCAWYKPSTIVKDKGECIIANIGSNIVYLIDKLK